MSQSSRANKIVSLLSRIGKRRKYQFQFEYSHSLPWLIVTRGEKQIAITYGKGSYKLTPIEGYRGLGYIHTLCYSKTRKSALMSIAVYFEDGYAALVAHALQSASEEADAGVSVSIEFVQKKLRKRLVRWRRSKNREIEIPPSLLSVVQAPGSGCE